MNEPSESIFDDPAYVGILIQRARDMRADMRKAGLIVALEDRPTLRLDWAGEKAARKHIHEGAWTVGLDDDELPGFYT